MNTSDLATSLTRSTPPITHQCLGGGRLAVLLLGAIMLACQGACAGPQTVAGDRSAGIPADYQPMTEADTTSVIRFDRLIHSNDRVVFLGDELTQQMFYTRMVTAALLPMRPNDNLRVFNGGYEGTTAASASQRFERVLEFTRPNVVFICLGSNDAQAMGRGELSRDTFRRHMVGFIHELQAIETIREIVLLSPPAIQIELGGDSAGDGPLQLQPGSENATLYQLSLDLEDIAKENNVNFIDLFEHTLAVYRAQLRVGGEPLTIGGRLPTAVGHLVIASIILRGMGVTSEHLAPVNWSPLLPAQMARVRQALAIALPVPSPERAEFNRALYLELQPFDEAFFRQWRIAGRSPSTPSVEVTAAAAEHAWERVRGRLRTSAAAN